MADDLAWVSTSVREPQDGQLVYARVRHGRPHRVMFHASPSPRWVGASIVFQFEYFWEWAPVEAEVQALEKTA